VDDVTQFCVEEACLMWLDHLDRGADIGDGGAEGLAEPEPVLSPHEALGAAHRERMARLMGGPV
jgi:hypothetical protein